MIFHHEAIYIYIVDTNSIEYMDLIWKLSADEIIYSLGLKHIETRKKYIISRAIKRYILGLFFWIPINKLVFKKDNFWKERLYLPNNNIPFSNYSLSHTEGFIVFSFSAKIGVWIDIENISLSNSFTCEDWSEIFSPFELYNIKKDITWTKFYEYWTMKEALSKAKWLWFNMNFKDIEIKLINDSSYELANSWERWDFFVFLLNQTHYCSLVYQKDEIYNIYINEICLNSDSNSSFQFINQSKMHTYHKHSISLL